MYIPTHYAILFAIILLCESAALFVYTVIGLVKSNPLPYMIPPQQLAMQQQQYQQNLPYCQQYDVPIPQQPQYQNPNGQLFTVPAISSATSILTSSVLETSTQSVMITTTVAAPTTTVESVLTTTAVTTSVEGVQSEQLPNPLVMWSAVTAPTPSSPITSHLSILTLTTLLTASASPSRTTSTTLMTVYASPAKSSTLSKRSTMEGTNPALIPVAATASPGVP